MTFSKHLLIRLKAAYDGASDYRVAKLLGVSPQCISRIKHEKNGFNDENLLKIAELLDEDPVTIVARAHISDDMRQDIKHLWGEILRRSDIAQALDLVGLSGQKRA